MESKALFSKHRRKTVFYRCFSGCCQYAGIRALSDDGRGVFVGRFWEKAPFAALNLAMPFVIINFALADLIGVARPFLFP